MEFAHLIRSPRVERVTLRRPFRPAVDGVLCVTGHHLIFSGGGQDPDELWLILRQIDAVDKKADALAGGGTLTVKCKDLSVVRLDVATTEELHNVAASLESLSSIEDQTLFYPFFYQPATSSLEDGWTAFRPEVEFSQLVQPHDDWRLSYVNQEFTVCPTYPAAVVVPRSVDDDVLVAAAAFRAGGRFPVLSYRHDAGAVLMRSSQPVSGANVKRCREDEKLLNSVLKPGMRGYIIDTRHHSAVQTPKSKVGGGGVGGVGGGSGGGGSGGGGVEPESHYPQWRRIHKPIERPYALLESLSKLVDACLSISDSSSSTSASVDKWLSRLEASQWLSHVKETLHCACLVAQCLDQEAAAVLLHGGAGLDSTLCVASLAQVILKADCRTVHGFEALVEREWIQAGHPFVRRHRRSALGGRGAAAGDAELAPTFLLFLDCTWQILQQFPCSFEFNEQLLLHLLRHSYASQFGSFLGNSPKERRDLGLAERTVSLWSHTNQPQVLRSFLNPIYEPNHRVIWPSVAPMSLTLWPTLYLSQVVDPSECERMWNDTGAVFQRDKELRSRAVRLRRQLAELERQAQARGLLVLGGPSPSD